MSCPAGFGGDRGFRDGFSSKLCCLDFLYFYFLIVAVDVWVGFVVFFRVCAIFSSIQVVVLTNTTCLPFQNRARAS